MFWVGLFGIASVLLSSGLAAAQGAATPIVATDAPSPTPTDETSFEAAAWPPTVTPPSESAVFSNIVVTCPDTTWTSQNASASFTHEFSEYTSVTVNFIDLGAAEPVVLRSDRINVSPTSPNDYATVNLPPGTYTQLVAVVSADGYPSAMSAPVSCGFPGPTPTARALDPDAPFVPGELSFDCVTGAASLPFSTTVASTLSVQFRNFLSWEIYDEIPATTFAPGSAVWEHDFVIPAGAEGPYVLRWTWASPGYFTVSGSIIVCAEDVPTVTPTFTPTATSTSSATFTPTPVASGTVVPTATSAPLEATATSVPSTVTATTVAQTPDPQQATPIVPTATSPNDPPTATSVPAQPSVPTSVASGGSVPKASVPGGASSTTTVSALPNTGVGATSDVSRAVTVALMTLAGILLVAFVWVAIHHTRRH